MEKILSIFALVVIFLVLIVCVRGKSKRLNPKYNLVDDVLMIGLCVVASFCLLCRTFETTRNMVFNDPGICVIVSLLGLIMFGGSFIYRNKEALKKT